ncbi:MAG: hypothetical protein ACI9U2_003752 [Bradymonadia bacterium]|jgi:hypothetical protein
MRDYGDSDVGELRQCSGRGPRTDSAPVVDIAAPDDPLAALATGPGLDFALGHSSGLSMFGGTSAACGSATRRADDRRLCGSARRAGRVSVDACPARAGLAASEAEDQLIGAGDAHGVARLALGEPQDGGFDAIEHLVVGRVVDMRRVEVEQRRLVVVREVLLIEAA